MGRINLVKMIHLPKLIYLVWHAPLYISARVFKSMEAIIKHVCIGPFPPQIVEESTEMSCLPRWSCSTRHCTVLCGLSIMPFFLYYNQNDRDRYSTLVCSSVPLFFPWALPRFCCYVHHGTLELAPCFCYWCSSSGSLMKGRLSWKILQLLLKSIPGAGTSGCALHWILYIGSFEYPVLPLRGCSTGVDP